MCSSLFIHQALKDMSDAVYLLCGPCTFQFGECIIVFHVSNLTYVRGRFYNAAGFLDMEADRLTMQ